MALTQAQINAGAFLPTTNVWDVSEIEKIDVNSEEFREVLVKLYRNINNIALSVNIRDAGFYARSEFVNGQLFFPNPALTSATSKTPEQRQVFRKVIDFGGLPNNGIKTVAHEIVITSDFSFTRIYGTASDPIGLLYIPLPFPTQGTGSIQLGVDATNVIVDASGNQTNFTTTYIVLEYIKE